MQSRTTGARTEVIELRRRVSYADLELGNESDVAELETRIEAIAKDACKKLSDMFPLSPSDRDEIRRCTNQAVDGAKEEMQEAIAAAS
jgi:UrcA family protein